MEALAKEMEEKFGPDSEFAKEMEEKFGARVVPSSSRRSKRSSAPNAKKMEAIVKEMEEKFGPDSEFAKKMEAMGKEIASSSSAPTPSSPRS